MIGTPGPKALAVTARHADIWNWDGPWEPTYRLPYERLQLACAEIGRPFEEIRLTAGLTVSMPDDPDTFVGSYEHAFYPGQAFPVLGPRAHDVIREIERLVDVGVSHFQVSLDEMSTLRRFVEDVVPVVRLDR
jgi:alkanesulfonate monooxygenase SsuD/methylene tetrahydromethanopterin reductase-like flavin-dependent oxidoreductase (luciferase family)